MRVKGLEGGRDKKEGGREGQEGGREGGRERRREGGIKDKRRQ